MRLMKRYLQTIQYCTYKSKEPIVDADGYYTGEYMKVYDEPKELVCSVSAASGNAQAEIFGTLEGYDKVIVTDDTNCPIDEHTLLFIDKPFSRSGALPDNDYIVKRVARTPNYISYAVQKVQVDG